MDDDLNDSQDASGVVYSVENRVTAPDHVIVEVMQSAPSTTVVGIANASDTDEEGNGAAGTGFVLSERGVEGGSACPRSDGDDGTAAAIQNLVVGNEASYSSKDGDGSFSAPLSDNSYSQSATTGSVSPPPPVAFSDPPTPAADSKGSVDGSGHSDAARHPARENAEVALQAEILPNSNLDTSNSTIQLRPPLTASTPSEPWAEVGSESRCRSSIASPTAAAVAAAVVNEGSGAALQLISPSAKSIDTEEKSTEQPIGGCGAAIDLSQRGANREDVTGKITALATMPKGDRQRVYARIFTPGNARPAEEAATSSSPLTRPQRPNDAIVVPHTGLVVPQDRAVRRGPHEWADAGAAFAAAPPMALDGRFVGMFHENSSHQIAPNAAFPRPLGSPPFCVSDGYHRHAHHHHAGPSTAASLGFHMQGGPPPAMVLGGGSIYSGISLPEAGRVPLLPPSTTGTGEGGFDYLRRGAHYGHLYHQQQQQHLFVTPAMSSRGVLVPAPGAVGGFPSIAGTSLHAEMVSTAGLSSPGSTSPVFYPDSSGGVVASSAPPLAAASNHAAEGQSNLEPSVVAGAAEARTAVILPLPPATTTTAAANKARFGGGSQYAETTASPATTTAVLMDAVGGVSGLGEGGAEAEGADGEAKQNNAYNDIGLVVTRTKELEKILRDMFGATGEFDCERRLSFVLRDIYYV